MKKWFAGTVALLLLAALFAISMYNYLLFHTLAEFFSIIIACGIFMVALNSRHYFANQYLLFIGIAYLFIGIIDLAHTFTYQGMNLMPGYGANTPTQLWIAARYLESLTLLIAPLTFHRRTHAGFYILGYGVLTLVRLVSILHWRIFPDCFLENAGGLTPFKKISEYIISVILLASGILLVFYRDRFDGKVHSWILLSIFMTILSELSFTTYAGVTDLSNLIGHYLKILSFILIYKAIIETGLTTPFDLLSRDLKQSKERHLSERKQSEVALRHSKELTLLVDTLRDENRQRQQAESELIRANEQLNARAAQLRVLAGELTMAEQRERMRLSRLLHDGLQQHLAAAKMQLACAAEQVDNATHRQALDAIIAILTRSTELARSLSADLSPPALHQGGLAQGLDWLARWVHDQYNFQVELCTDEGAVLSMDVKIILFESIRELLFNAIKHAGVVSAEVHLQRVEEAIRITVADEGVGFDPSRLKTTGDIGAGLGLFSIQERIGLIGGHFKIDSTPGKGSCFTLTIPHEQASAAVCPVHCQPAATGNENADTSMQGAKKSIRVLVADDHTLFRDGLVRLLNREPDIDVVDQARDGQEAIVLARKLVPDVILMDISMPVLNGIEATKAIHLEFPAIRIIGLSMHESSDGAKAMRDAGAIGYKNKDSTAAELAAVIRTCFRDAPFVPVDASKNTRAALQG